MVKIRDVRKCFVQRLGEVKNIKIIPSQANYIMLELTGDITARELIINLMKKYNLFIKDLRSKIKRNERQFIRVAVRDEVDNNKLVDALLEELN